MEVNGADIANWNQNVCFFGLFEIPLDVNESANLTGEIRHSRISDANFAGLILVGQTDGFGNPDAPITMDVDVQDVLFERNDPAIRVQPAFDGTVNTASRNFTVRAQDNTYVANARDTVVSFRTRGSNQGAFATVTDIVVEDGDGVFPDEADVKVGAAQLGNSY